MRDEERTKDQLISELTDLRKRLAKFKTLESVHREHEQLIKQRLEFEKVVASISSRFVGIGEMDRAISQSLEELGVLSSADRAYLFLMDKDGTTISNTHEWCAEGIRPEIDNLQKLPIETIPWWWQKLKNREIIHITDVDGMPEEASAEKAILQQQNIKSPLVLPVHARENLIGFIGFDDVVDTGQWKENDIVILRTVSEIIGSAFERSFAEKAIRKERERAEKYFDLAPVFMLAIDGNGIISDINKRGCEILLYAKADIVGKDWFEEFVTDDSKDALREIYQKILTGEVENVDYLESAVVTKSGKERIIAWHSSILKNEKDEIIGILSSGEDVTQSKIAEEKIKRKLMKYNLQDGRMYLIKESSLHLSLEAFRDLLKLSYDGVIISRSSEEDLTAMVSEEFSYYWLAEMENGNTLFPTLSDIEEIFESLKRKTVVLMDRIDYLISKIGFERTLECIQRLREMAYIKGYVIIISLDPLTLKHEELRLLEKEGLDVGAYDESSLTDYLSEVLLLVHKQNAIGLKPSYSLLGDELGISKPTMRKRMGILKDSGYLQEEVIGRRKIVELTEKGKQFFRK